MRESHAVNHLKKLYLHSISTPPPQTYNLTNLQTYKLTPHEKLTNLQTYKLTRPRQNLQSYANLQTYNITPLTFLDIP